MSFRNNHGKKKRRGEREGGREGGGEGGREGGRTGGGEGCTLLGGKLRGSGDKCGQHRKEI